MYIKLVTSYILFLFLFSIPQFSQAQIKYNFERINTENGLPTNAIKGLQFDEKTRFLWVATESGIVRYNGHGFQNFGDNDKTAILNGRIVLFDKTNNGKLFGKLIDERVFVINENKAVIDNSVAKLNGEINYLNYKYNLVTSNSIKNVVEIENKDFILNNKIYSIIDQTLYKYEQGKLVYISNFLNEEDPFILDNKLYLLNKNGSILNVKFVNEKLVSNTEIELGKNFKYNPKNIFSRIRVYQNNPQAPVYLITGSKLFSLSSNNSKIISSLITDQLPTNEIIKYVQIDKVSNTIYIGTDNRGLIVGRPKYFNRILPNNAIEGISTSAYAQIQLSNGNIQINTGQIFGDSKLNVAKVFYRTSETGTFVSSDSILFVTNSDGIVEYDLKQHKVTNVSNHISYNRNSFIEIDGKIYSFNDRGIAVKSKIKTWSYLTEFNHMPFNFIVYSLYKINNNEILAATTDGLYKYNLNQNSFKLFYKNKDNANFRTIYNLNNYFLIGTYGGGVFMFHNDSIKKLPLDQNKYLNYTHCFIQDKKGNVWASTNKGLFMSPGESLIDFWKNGPGNIKFRYFGKSDGIDELEMNGGCTPCAIKLRNGHFSFPGIDGLIQFSPDSIPDIDIQPKVYIDKLIVDNKFIKIDQFENEFQSNIKNIEIQLGISGMLSQENIMLEYKFDNESWVRLNVKNPIIAYSNPKFGAHVLSIRLRNTINSKWQSVEYVFSIKYPWFLNPYMFVVYILLMLGLVLFYIRFKTIIYQRRQKLLEKEVDAKTISLNKLNENLTKRNQAKDHVIAIMNHDILTPLKYLHITAKNIAENTEEELVKLSIKQIAKTSKDLEYLTSNMLNWVKFESVDTFPKKQNVDLFLLVNDLVEFVEPFKQNQNLKIINHIPEDLLIQNWPDSLRVLLYNLVVNAINNTNKGQISIHYSAVMNGYKISVTDTGVGMNESMIQYLLNGKSKDEVEQIPKYKKGNGVGFQIIRNIIQLMKARLVIESIENRGTTVSVLFID
jgi:signal transduction histidine kinase